MKHFIDHAMDKVTLLLDKTTGEEVGKILAYYSSNPAGSVCHACVILYSHGWEIMGKDAPENRSEEGKAGGYGYDKYSAAVADSLRKQGLGGTHEEINGFTFGDSTFSEKSNTIRKEAEKAIIERKIIPVYSGAGNVNEAFSLYFRVIEIL